MARKQPDPDCDTCGGQGYTTIPAAQIGGRIIDETTHDCHCVKQPDHEEDQER